MVLHFAEIYWKQVGQRVFDISLEGATVRTNYDIVKEVGPLTATTQTFAVRVTDGVLNLDLRVPYERGGADQAKLSAIEVLKKDGPAAGRSNQTLATISPSTGREELLAYPNPSAGRFTLACTTSQAQAALLTLTDQLGRVVHQQAVQMQAGANQVAVEAPSLAQGLYQLSLRTADGQRQNQRMMIRP